MSWHLVQSLHCMVKSYLMSQTLEDLDHKLRIVTDQERYRKILTFPMNESTEWCF